MNVTTILEGNSILFVVFVFGTASSLVAQEHQAVAAPNSSAPAVASPRNGAPDGAITTESQAVSNDPEMLEKRDDDTSPSTERGANSKLKNKRVLDYQGDPDAPQNQIEYGGGGA